jgi:hypothetical protein
MLVAGLDGQWALNCGNEEKKPRDREAASLSMEIWD